MGIIPGKKHQHELGREKKVAARSCPKKRRKSQRRKSSGLTRRKSSILPHQDSAETRCKIPSTNHGISTHLVMGVGNRFTCSKRASLGESDFACRNISLFSGLTGTWSFPCASSRRLPWSSYGITTLRNPLGAFNA